MYGTTAPRVEKKLLAIIWSIAVASGLLFVCHARSAHVTSVRRKKQDNGDVVYVVKVTNPTAQKISATVKLATGNRASDSAAPWGSIHQEKIVDILPNSVATVEFKIESKHARFLGNSYSALISETAVYP